MNNLSLLSYDILVIITVVQTLLNNTDPYWDEDMLYECELFVH